LKYVSIFSVDEYRCTFIGGTDLFSGKKRLIVHPVEKEVRLIVFTVRANQQFLTKPDFTGSSRKGR
jgi:hypothetical protein